MKKTFITLLVLGLVIQANAQLRDVMLKKAGDKIKKNKIENTGTTNGTTDPQNQDGNANGQTNTTPEQNKTENTTTPPPAYNPYLNQGGKKEIKPTYKFDQNVLMEMTSYDSKGKAKEKGAGKTRMHFGKESYSGIESYDEKNVSRGFTVFEADKNQMVMLMDNDGQKIAMVHSFDPSKYSDKDGKKEGEKKPTITKTGRTKKVCGYTCEEWTSVDEKGEKTEMWVSSEAPVKATGFYSMFSNQNKGYGKYFGNSADYPQGFMMEMTHYENNGEKFTMTTTEVNVNAPKTIETAGYQVY